MNDYTNLIERLTVSAGDQECLYSDAKNAIEALQSRVAELEAERAEREAGKLLAYLSNDRTQFFVPSMEGKDVKHAPYMAHWMAGWTPLCAAPPVTAPVRLTDDQVERALRTNGAYESDAAYAMAKDGLLTDARAIETAVLRANGFKVDE